MLVKENHEHNRDADAASSRLAWARMEDRATSERARKGEPIVRTNSASTARACEYLARRRAMTREPRRSKRTTHPTSRETKSRNIKEGDAAGTIEDRSRDKGTESMAFRRNAMQPDDRMRKTELAHSCFSEGIASTRTGKSKTSAEREALND